MRTYQVTDERWYADVTPLLKRVRRWVVSCAWESPTWTEAGYTYRWRVWRSVGLAQRARGHRSRLFALYSSLCPLALFGHRVVFHHFGIDISRRRDYLCIHWGHRGKGDWQIYASRNATPSSAHWWLVGAPSEVQGAADAHHVERAERQRQYDAHR